MGNCFGFGGTGFAAQTKEPTYGKGARARSGASPPPARKAKPKSKRELDVACARDVAFHIVVFILLLERPAV